MKGKKEERRRVHKIKREEEEEKGGKWEHDRPRPGHVQMHAFQKISAQILPLSSFGPYKQCHENAYAARLELEDILAGRMTRRVYGDGESKKLRETRAS